MSTGFVTIVMVDILVYIYMIVYVFWYLFVIKAALQPLKKILEALEKHFSGP